MAGTFESAPSEEEPRTYVSTPKGLVTQTGRWYHIPEEELREYAGAVLDYVSLEQLVRWAETWIESPRTVALWTLPVTLWVLPVEWAVVTTLGLYVGWALLSPAVPAVWGARVVSGLENVFVQGGYYALVLSVFAGREEFGAVGTGLLAFILFRWRIVDWLGQAALQPLRRRLYPLPVADQVLRGLIVRAALKYRVSVPQVDVLTREVIERWSADRGSSDTSNKNSCD